MITGKLMYDITIETEDEKSLENLGADIRNALRAVNGVKDSEEVDSEITDDSDEPDND